MSSEERETGHSGNRRSRDISRDRSPGSSSPAPNRRYTRSRSSSRSQRRRSRSRTPSRRNGFGSRGSRRSKSPMSSRRRHNGDREDPVPSRCIGVFGLSLYTSERQVSDIFKQYGEVEKTQLVLDAKTRRSRGFAFVYFANDKQAAEAKRACTGMEVDGRQIRVDFSITARAHTPTPGVYMGKPTVRSERYGGSSRGYRGDRYQRSPSPIYRSRSRRDERFDRRSRDYDRRDYDRPSRDYDRRDRYDDYDRRDRDRDYDRRDRDYERGRDYDRYEGGRGGRSGDYYDRSSRDRFRSRSRSLGRA